ncbi:hypothetical protein SprV_0301115600 [Sparganum proliferum]
MGLFGHMQIHESGIDRSLDSPNTSSTPIMSSPALTPPPCAPTATSSITPSALRTPTTLSPTSTPPSNASTAIASTTNITDLCSITDNGTISCDITASHCPIILPSLRRKVFSSQHNLSDPGSRTTEELVSDRFICPVCIRIRTLAYNLATNGPNGFSVN